MQKVKKAIIPAAGLGTRFLPATKSIPKEMFPIVDRPTIEYIVEEAIQSGIEEIMIVTGRAKGAIENHFDRNVELEYSLASKGKLDLLEKIQGSSRVDLYYIRQKEPKGLGHAVWCARKFVGNEPFAVLLGDDVVQSEKPATKQLIEQFEATNSSVIGVQPVPDGETNRYGIIDPIGSAGRLYQVRNFVEKPAQGKAPSNLAILGRYILTPEIFQFLEWQETGVGGEIQLTDAIQKLNEMEKVYAYDFEGKRYDVGEKLGFVRTTLEFALEHEEIGPQVEELLREILLKKELLSHPI